MIVLGFDEEATLGEIRFGVKDEIFQWHPQAVKIIRECIFEEWRECFLSRGGDPIFADMPLYSYYYEVLTD
jgi:hypothetical protein